LNYPAQLIFPIKMLESWQRNSLANDEPQRQLAIQLMKAAADEILHGKQDWAAFSQFIANQPWSKEETTERLKHLIALLSTYRDNRLRDGAIRIAQSVCDELATRQ
jgi:hypothetical protein